jgi:hypothetical protein
MSESTLPKKKLDKCVKGKYKNSLDAENIDEEVVTVKKKEIINALTILEGVKRGLRKVLDKHSA